MESTTKCDNSGHADIIGLFEASCRCGEMADATDLKSVLANREVWVRIPSSAPSKTRFHEKRIMSKDMIERLRILPQRDVGKGSLFAKCLSSLWRACAIVVTIQINRSS